MLHPHPHFDPFRLTQSEERWNSEREELPSDHASVGVITSLGGDILLSQGTQYYSLVRKEKGSLSVDVVHLYRHITSHIYHTKIS